MVSRNTRNTQKFYAINSTYLIFWTEETVVVVSNCTSITDLNTTVTQLLKA